MAIVGSVFDEQTVTANVTKQFTINMPQSDLTIVAIFHNATFMTIPIDASRNAVIPNAGSGQLTYPARISTIARRVTIPVNGNTFTYSVNSGATTTDSCFYYGTPLTDGIDFHTLSGTIATVTLSSGAGSGTFQFPSGKLTLTGLTACFGTATASPALLVTFNTSAGQQFNAYLTSRLLTTSNGSNSDILPLALPIAQSVDFTLSKGLTTDVVYAIAYYQ